MISTVLNEAKLTPAKSGHIPHSYNLSVSCYLSNLWAFAFFSILYPEKNIRLPHGYPSTHCVGISGLTKLVSCQKRLGQVLQVHRLALWVVTYIHAQELMYDLSNNTVALRNFLPTAYGLRCFFQEFTVVNHTNLSLTFEVIGSYNNDQVLPIMQPTSLLPEMQFQGRITCTTTSSIPVTELH